MNEYVGLLITVETTIFYGNKTVFLVLSLNQETFFLLKKIVLRIFQIHIS